MNSNNVEQLAAEYAKEIVVAKASNTNLVMNAETGKNVADFYTGIFKGISATLKSFDFTYKG